MPIEKKNKTRRCRQIGFEIGNLITRTRYVDPNSPNNAARCAGRLPTPFEIWFRAGNIHDLTALKEHGIRFSNGVLFGDKAFCDIALKELLKEYKTEEVNICRPLLF